MTKFTGANSVQAPYLIVPSKILLHAKRKRFETVQTANCLQEINF